MPDSFEEGGESWTQADSNGNTSKHSLLHTKRLQRLSARSVHFKLKRRQQHLVQLEAVARKLVLEDADILKMKVADITMQLRYLRSLKEDNKIPRPKDIKNKQDGLKALLAAME